MIFTSVDLPAPFSPSSAWISPGTTSKLDPVVGEHAREALGDAAQLQARRRVTRGLVSCCPLRSPLVGRSSAAARLPRAPAGSARPRPSAAITAGRLSRSADRRSGRPGARSRRRRAALARAALEPGALGLRADQAEIGEVAAPQDALAELEIEAWLWVSTRIGGAGRARARPRPAAARSRSDLDARRAAGSGTRRRGRRSSAAGRQRRQRAGERPADMAGAEQQHGGSWRARRPLVGLSSASAAASGGAQAQRDGAAAALAERARAERRGSRRGLARRPSSSPRARRSPSARGGRRRSCRAPRSSVTSMRAPASRGAEPWPPRPRPRPPAPPRGEQRCAGRRSAVVMPPASAAGSAQRARSRQHRLGRGRRVEARADACSPRRWRSRRGARATPRSPSISGGSPTALLRWIVSSRFAALSSRRDVEDRRAGRWQAGIL